MILGIICHHLNPTNIQLDVQTDLYKEAFMPFKAHTTFHYIIASFSSIPMAMDKQSSLNSQRKQDQDLKEWGVKARMISRDNTISRRFSSSHITSFREDACKSFRSNFTISSSASSPGYSLKGINIYLA